MSIPHLSQMEDPLTGSLLTLSAPQRPLSFLNRQGMGRGENKALDGWKEPLWRRELLACNKSRLKTCSYWKNILCYHYHYWKLTINRLNRLLFRLTGVQVSGLQSAFVTHLTFTLFQRCLRFIPNISIYSGLPWSGKSQGKKFFFKVRGKFREFCKRSGKILEVCKSQGIIFSVRKASRKWSIWVVFIGIVVLISGSHWVFFYNSPG